jgi:Icc-related predicted phosphoesterase
VKICIISDTHELESEVEISPCDLLIHCGDWSFFGRSIRAMEAFNDWLGEQPARHKVITAGNHEYPVAAHPDRWRRRMSNATLLLNESANIAGVRIWGSPVTRFEGGAFGIGDEAVREKLYSAISEGTDILVTHQPPLGVHDRDQGCPALRRGVIRVKPRLHCYGHIHAAYGTQATKNTLFVNAALLDPYWAPSRRPILLDFKV